MPRKPHRIKLERIRKVVEARLLGKTEEAIAKDLNCCRKTIYNYLRYADEHPELFGNPYERWFVWTRLNRLLEGDELTSWQKAKILQRLTATLEPIQKKLEIDEKPTQIKVVMPWARGSGETEEDG